MSNATRVTTRLAASSVVGSRAAGPLLNDIPERQNRPAFLQLLRAKSALYDTVQWWYTRQIWFVVGVPLALAVLKLLVPALGTYALVAALAVAAADFLLLEPRQKELRGLAARMQEAFDCDLFGLPWADFAVGARPQPAEVEKWARRHAGATGLRNWYSPEIGRLPLAVARIACQRSSVHWSGAMRRRYARALRGGCALVAALLLILAVARNLPVLDVLMWLGTLLPLWMWSLKEARRQAESADTSQRTAAQADGLLRRAQSGHADEATLTAESRELQTAIFRQRASDPQVLDVVYRRFRDEDEAAMRANVRGLVLQTGNTSPLPSA